MSINEDSAQFVIDALFESQEAVEFHHGNIADIVKEFGGMMAAPPETVITPVIAAASWVAGLVELGQPS